MTSSKSRRGYILLCYLTNKTVCEPFVKRDLKVYCLFVTQKNIYIFRIIRSENLISRSLLNIFIIIAFFFRHLQTKHHKRESFVDEKKNLQLY